MKIEIVAAVRKQLAAEGDDAPYTLLTLINAYAEASLLRRSDVPTAREPWRARDAQGADSRTAASLGGLLRPRAARRRAPGAGERASSGGREPRLLWLERVAAERRRTEGQGRLDDRPDRLPPIDDDQLLTR